ncbi:hypothetical protein, partial [Salmonella sp. 741265100_HSA]
SSVPIFRKKDAEKRLFFRLLFVVVCRSDKTLRRHPTLLQPMMALRLSGQQTPYIPRIKKAAFAALK